jgi:hypothetical protein
VGCEAARKAGKLTCHAPGTFLKFAITISIATILDLLPGPVKVLIMSFWKFTREAAVPKMRVVVNAMDFRGNLLAEAILTI